MSYIVPSVLVYQELASNGGVANITPVLDACIVGPCNNVVSYVPDSLTSLAKTLAHLVDGTTPATITGSAINAYLPSAKPGQLVNVSSIDVYLNAASVVSKTMTFKGDAGSNVMTVYSPASFTATGTSGSPNVTLANAGAYADVYENDTITIAGAGAGGTLLTARIVSRVGAAAVLSVPLGTTVTTAVANKVSFLNTNLNTSTLRVEPGDTLTMVPVSGSTINTKVLAVSQIAGEVATFTTIDTLPAGSGTATKYTITVTKSYNNLLLPISYTTPTGVVTNYVTTNAGASGYVTVNYPLAVAYGSVVAGTVYIDYLALRTDLSATVLDINNVDDQVGFLGDATDLNPLALGVELALANTTSRIRAIAVATNDLSGYLAALDLAESQRLYALTPLTQDISILEAFQQHVEQFSVPEEALWRMTFVNTAIPAVNYVGQYNPALVNANGGNNTITLTSGHWYLNSSNSIFISDGVTPGDVVKVTAATPGGAMALTVLTVVSNQTLEVSAPTAGQTAVSFYIQRNLTKSQQADAVAAASDAFKSSRVVHVQPDLCGVEVGGVTKYLPGYYLCCALAGLVSGLPAQKGLTNIGMAGISDLTHSNFYFTRSQLNTMAAAGTLLVVQETQGGLPYVRHSLTTDMTVLQYREVQQVKNIDYVSYFFYDILKGFPGIYNVTPDTLQTLRTTINAGGQLLKGKKLPKLGAPLLDFQINSLAQDPANKDQVIIKMPITIPTVMNYVNLYLIV